MTLLLLTAALPVYNLIVSVYNLFTSRKLKAAIIGNRNSLVSILIPARNEENNIGEIIKCLLAQSYENTEIVILDDMSNDNTYSVCRKFSETDKRVRPVKGKELPSGWLGKNWACCQLSEIAKGDYFLFIDADVRLERNAVESSLHEMIKSRSDVLTVYPLQKMITAGEKICVGALNWIVYSFLPISKVYKSKSKYITAGVGQYMLWKKDVYVNSGGHHSVKDKIVEDIELGKYLKGKGYRINLLRGGELISCRMYSSFREAVNGFTKNAYPVTNDSSVLFLLSLIILSASYLLPLIFIDNSIFYLFLLMIILIQRLTVSYMSGGNALFEIIMYPFQIIVMVYIGIRSYVNFKNKNLQWKERNL